MSWGDIPRGAIRHCKRTDAACEDAGPGPEHAIRSAESPAAASAGTGENWPLRWSGTRTVAYPSSSARRARASHRSPLDALLVVTPNRNGCMSGESLVDT